MSVLVSSADTCLCATVSSGDVSGMESVWHRWRERLTLVEAEYDTLQRVLIQRCTLARLCTSVMPATLLCTVFEDWTAAARKAGRFQVSCYLLKLCLLYTSDAADE